MSDNKVSFSEQVRLRTYDSRENIKKSEGFKNAINDINNNIDKAVSIGSFKLIDSHLIISSPCSLLLTQFEIFINLLMEYYQSEGFKVIVDYDYDNNARFMMSWE
jgi:uncharacterized protein (DUF302 family)